MNAPAQPSLFDRYGMPARQIEQEPSPAAPAAKRNPPLTARGDPLTSHIAEARFTSSGRRASLNRVVLDGLSACPTPVTFHELARVIEQEDHNTMKRLNDLRRRGFVEQCERRNCSISGQPCVTWRAIDGNASKIQAPAGAAPVPRAQPPEQLAAGAATGSTSAAEPTTGRPRVAAAAAAASASAPSP